jgi:hypothetical protein
MRVGIAHHLGWAVAVIATDDHVVVERRRIELIGPGLPPAPVHHEGGPHRLHRTGPALSDNALAELVAAVRASSTRATTAALEALANSWPAPIDSLSLRAWPADFPQDIAIQRRVPYESRADSVMYCQVLADVARGNGWRVHLYNARHVEDDAAHILGDRADDVLHGQRRRLGPPWTRDHRMALAATVVAG